MLLMHWDNCVRSSRPSSGGWTTQVAAAVVRRCCTARRRLCRFPEDLTRIHSSVFCSVRTERNPPTSSSAALEFRSTGPVHQRTSPRRAERRPRSSDESIVRTNVDQLTGVGLRSSVRSSVRHAASSSRTREHRLRRHRPSRPGICRSKAGHAGWGGYIRR